MDDWTHRPPVAREANPQQMFCAPGIADSYPFGSNSYSAGASVRIVAVTLRDNPNGPTVR
jgi:hypothetical protein